MYWVNSCATSFGAGVFQSDDLLTLILQCSEMRSWPQLQLVV